MHAHWTHTTGKLTISENDLHENLEYFFLCLMTAIKYFILSSPVHTETHTTHHNAVIYGMTTVFSFICQNRQHEMLKRLVALNINRKMFKKTYYCYHSLVIWQQRNHNSFVTSLPIFSFSSFRFFFLLFFNLVLFNGSLIWFKWLGCVFRSEHKWNSLLSVLLFLPIFSLHFYDIIFMGSVL